MTTENHSPGSDIRTGWLCPGCGTVYSPEVPKCETCKLAVLTRIHQCVEPKESDNRVLDRPIESLNLSVRSGNCLASDRVATVRELCSRTERDLLRIRGFGKTGLREVKRKLAELNLYLKSQVSP